MRGTANESLYKDLESEFGAQDYELPVSMAIRPLRLSDLDAVEQLETLCFPENERATREKLEYRLRVCPELCVGVFERDSTWKSRSTDLAGVAASETTITREVLVGHIIATKTASEFVTDSSMDAGTGHNEEGHTIALHSLCVHPDFRHKHVGYVMIKDYIQRFYSLSTADGIALLAHEELVPFYRKHGFKPAGPSQSEFGGTSWLDMRLAFM